MGVGGRSYAEAPRTGPMDLEGAVAVITGASSGIGAATARAMAGKGATVILLARDADRLDAVVERIEGHGGAAAAYPVDLTDSEAVEETAAAIREEYGVPDVLVNNAGMGQWRSIEETEPEEAVAMMEVPYLAAFRTTRAFIEGMLEREQGHIVNVTSAASYVPWPGATAYISARWAVRGFSEALVTDLRGTGVGVSLVAATTVESPYWEHNPGSRERLPGIARLYGTLTPEDVAEAIVTAVETERSEVFVPFLFRLSVYANRLVPGLFRWLATRTGWRRPL